MNTEFITQTLAGMFCETRLHNTINTSETQKKSVLQHFVHDSHVC